MQGIAGTTATTAATGQAVPQPRLVRAAQEFEAQMMKELLKPMTSDSALTGEDADSEAGSGGALCEFASESLGRALSAGGGFGIAHRLIADLSHSGNRSTTAPVTGNLHIDTGMRARE